MNITGRVEKKPFAVGTKSEHKAVVLVTPSGEFRLRRLGGNPFQDSVLDGLVGTEIEATGTLTGQTFIMSQWHPEAEQARG